MLSTIATFLSITDVTVGLQEGAYTVSEGDGSVSVCAELTGQIARNVVVSIFTEGGDATGQLE